MFAGHAGAALSLGAADRKIPLGALLAASFFLDLLLWLLVLAGVESIEVPLDYAEKRYLTFVFPYSHGLLAALFWSALAAAVAWRLAARWETSRERAALLIGAAAFSHWLLDAIVHVADLPLLSSDSMRVGAGLWDVMPVALALEAGIGFSGALAFLAVREGTGWRRFGLVAVMLVLIAMTVFGQTDSPPPTSARKAAAISLLGNLCAIAIPSLLWGWRRRALQRRGSALEARRVVPSLRRTATARPTEGSHR